MTARSRAYKKAVLSQGEPRDAAVNFDTYRILQRQCSYVRFLCHSTAFLLASIISDSSEAFGKKYQKEPYIDYIFNADKSLLISIVIIRGLA